MNRVEMLLWKRIGKLEKRINKLERKMRYLKHQNKVLIEMLRIEPDKFRQFINMAMRLGQQQGQISYETD